MKLVLSWLDDLAPGLAPTGTDPQPLAERMTALGMQVEEILHVGATVDGVITAKVLRTERHPDAAKVHRVWVDAGDGVERHVWCGAFNMSPGDVIPLATPGTRMPDGRLIEPRPILGIDSQGMLCSARELGLGDDHSGILILDGATPLGLPYGEALALRSEVVFDVDLTRNRPDCWGHLGAARDVAARVGVDLAPGPPPLAPTGDARSATVELVDGERCPRFTTVVLSGIRVGPSPEWMVRRLQAAGMRSISNVVDVSNYVMLELNQPNHAYDLDTLGGHGFRIRLARDGEQMTTLDGTVRTFTADDLLICDAHDVPIGVGGVMGGLDSEITDATSVVALEIASFEQTGITRTMNRLGFRSEASGRFERGVDPYGIERAQARFVELLRETCPDLVVHDGAVDARHESLAPRHRTTPVRVSQVNRILGTALDADSITGLIGPIGYTVERVDGDVLTVALPSWRTDSHVEIDVVEEVARHHGYDTIGTAVPNSTMHGRLSPEQLRRRQLREVLLGCGLSEAITDSFLHRGDLGRAHLPDDAIHVTNPLQADEDVLRPSMRVGMLKAIAFNESHRRRGVQLFEIGHVYPPGDRSTELPPEYDGLSVAIAGGDARDAMALWREIAKAMGFGARVDQGTVPAGLHPTRSATLSLGKDVVGAVGEVHPDVCDAFGVDERVAWLELDLSRLLAVAPKIAQWKPTSRFPSTDLDLAFVVPDQVAAEKVDKAIRQAAVGLLVDLTLFDVYRGRGVDEGARSLAYRLRLQAPDRTLTDAEVTQVKDKVVAGLAKLRAVLRS
ncbi:MAG: phenylalanine--tRNA ligase subunit beta [Acidimicrobiales bacterium]|nr:phenylalanine--tRNA ligase subunit beta [Acidimicrobiales bacterium]MCB9395421.1 phenylalanine--tRNA ligase subunit beta [Acidimicrobiaceae bacterium]